MKTSFGEYFDKQRARMINAMQNKNTELNVQWREDYDKRQDKKESIKYAKELRECSDRGDTISDECKAYYNKFYEKIR